MTNEKVLVEVAVPAADEKYDVFIPLKSKMRDVIKMVACALTELSNGNIKLQMMQFCVMHRQVLF